MERISLRTKLALMTAGLLAVCGWVRAENVLVMREDFECGLPTPWCKLYGWPTWATVDDRQSEGWRSAYCAGSYHSPPGPYEDNMDAWMIFGPFDLSDAYDAWVEFDMWLESEWGCDYLQWMVSTDGHHFYGYSESGSSSWWWRSRWECRELDLTDVPHLGDVCGEPAVWIAFVFTSDDRIEYEGAYVDDVEVWKKVASSTVPSTYAISGRVIDVNGLGVPGAVVYAGNRKSAPADSDGCYTIADIPAGNYSLRAALDGYDLFPHNFLNPVCVSCGNLHDYNFIAIPDGAADVIHLPPAAIGWHYKVKLPLPLSIWPFQKPRWFLAPGESLPPGFRLTRKGKLWARARDVRVAGDYSFRLTCVPARGGAPVEVLCLIAVGDVWNRY